MQIDGLDDWNIDRRMLLKAVSGTGVALGGLTGSVGVTAQESDGERTLPDLDDRARFNIGYATPHGAELAREAANGVVHEIDPIDAITIESTLDAAQDLAGSGHIEFVEVDSVYRLILPPQEVRDRDLTDQRVPWGIERIGAPAAHAAGIRGESAHVAVINTGIDPTHEDLRQNVGDGIGVIPCRGECETEWDDDFGHGTHVAGTIGALDNWLGVLGVAPDATLHSAKVLNSNGVGFASDVALGILWTAAQGYDVANMSLGGPFSTVVQDALEFAAERDVLLVAAAGNQSGPVSYPAAADEVIAVSATTETDELAVFSNVGPEIELAAPGVDVLSTLPNDRYAKLSGTSMAAPHVSGTGALLAGIGYSADEARTFMKETAEDLGLPPEEQGAGLVTAAAVAERRPKKGGRKTAP
ncbi:S8 family peptidase [Halopiger thermotolerans]